MKTTMRLSLLVPFLALAMKSADSFSILPSAQPKMQCHPSSMALRYTIIGPPPDDDDMENEQTSPKQQKAATANDQAGPGSLEGYRDYNELEDVEEMLNVDAFDNKAGGIVPGFHLSSLCSDD